MVDESEEPLPPSLGKPAKWIASLAALWFLTVVANGLLSGAGITLPTLAFDYSLSADFGDSFGSLSALFAALAAIGAWRAVQLQQHDLKTRAKDQRDQAKLTKQTSFETTFFNLLQVLNGIVDSTDIKPSSFRRLQARVSGEQAGSLDVQTGKDAFRRLASIFLDKIDRPETDESLEDSWERHYDSYKDDLGHYFRVLYQIILFTKTSCPTAPKFYTNIVRAQMSNSELILLAYNCAYGHGRARFKTLVEEFEFFDNIDLQGLAGVEATLRTQFAPSAFGAQRV